MRILLVSVVLLLSAGCARIATDGYCDIASPLYFDTDRTVSWLLQNDRTLLVDIIVHNETTRRICNPSLG
jgi:hypothetical protein